MDTLIAENYILDASLDRNPLDADRRCIKQRNITPISDQQRGSGSYSTSTVIFDSNSLGNGDDFIDWRNATIAIPYQILLTSKSTNAITVTGSTTSDKFYPNYFTALKNNSLIESIEISYKGNTIVSSTQNLSHLVNFVKHATTTADSLNKDSGLYFPDSIGNYSTTNNLGGVVNNSNAPTILTNAPDTMNHGLLRRQSNLCPPNTSFSSTAAQLAEQLPFQKVAPTTSTDLSNTNTATISDLHFLAVIKLSDLSDYFNKHPLSRGIGYRIVIRVNQATTEMTLTQTSDTTKPFDTLPTIKATTLVGNSTTQPAMICIGPNTIASNTATSNAATGNAMTLTLKSQIDTSANDARQTGCTLYVPSYILSEEYEEKMLKHPVITRSPFQVTSAVYAGQKANVPINLQLFSAISNPRALIVIPQFSQETQGQASQASPLNPAPGTTDPGLSLTKIQVRVNSKQLLPSQINYSFQQFMDHTSRIFSTNGNQSSITSGVFNFTRFMHNYRYYAFDLTTACDESQRDLPMLISFEAFNNSAVSIDLYVYVLSESSATFDVLKGTVDIK